MEKAFDKLSWQYLDAVLNKFGFHRNFIELNMGIVMNPRFSIIINGSPSSWFHSEGCPLSPFLFILCTNMLSRFLHNLSVAGSTGSIKGYQPSRGGSSITHLMFAGDLPLIAKATRRNALQLKKAVMPLRSIASTPACGLMFKNLIYASMIACQLE